MRRIRVIPTLLIQNGGLVKPVKFKKSTYIGDPINAVKIFNEKEVDEIAIIDMDATRLKRTPNIAQIRDIASEAFMPLGYGGGITTVAEVREILFAGAEKVIINNASIENPSLITESAKLCGSQSVVISMDVSKNWLGKYKVYTQNGKNNTGIDPVQHARNMENAGAGEIFLMSIDREGTYEGYDIELIQQVANAVSIPLIVCGGASSIADFRRAVVEGGASAVAAGSMFVYSGAMRGVLINYPKQDELKEGLFRHL